MSFQAVLDWDRAAERGAVVAARQELPPGASLKGLVFARRKWDGASMRKWSRKLIVLAGAGVLAFVAWLVLREPPEPEYKGKPLSYWLRLYVDPQGGGSVLRLRSEPNQAVMALGTNCIPTLLELMHAKDSPLKHRLIELSRKQRLIKMRVPFAEEKYLMAWMGFQTLGMHGSNAIPGLCDVLTGRHPPLARKLSALSLGYFGAEAEGAVPLLLTCATNAHDAASADALTALALIHARPELVIPALTNLLHGTNVATRSTAITTLGFYGKDAEPFAPELLLLLKDKERAVRAVAAATLGKIYNVRDWGFSGSGLSGQAYKPEPLIRIVDGMGTMGGTAESVVPALVILLSDEDDGVRKSATNALRRIDPDAAEKAGAR